MLRTCPRVIALTAMVTCLSITAQAADAVVTLACEGIVTSKTQRDAKPEPISTRFLINFDLKVVSDFMLLGVEFILLIKSIDDVHILFGRSEPGWDVRGSINRETGAMEVSTVGVPSQGDAAQYSLKCKPVQRMF